MSKPLRIIGILLITLGFGVFAGHITGFSYSILGIKNHVVAYFYDESTRWIIGFSVAAVVLGLLMLRIPDSEKPQDMAIEKEDVRNSRLR